MFYYLSHPEVTPDPTCDPALWRLSQRGRDRTQDIVQSGAVAHIKQVVTSAETKAVETGAIIAGALGCPILIRPRLNETSDDTADLQSRIVAEVSAIMRTAPDNTLFIGHPYVGTVLRSKLTGFDISPDTAGSFYAWSGETSVVTAWTPMEHMG